MVSPAERKRQFTELYQNNRQRLARICRAYAPGDEAQDLFQDVWLNVWNCLETFRGEAHIDTWLYRVAVNTALAFRRNYGRRRRGRDGLCEPDALAHPGDLVRLNETNELRQQLYETIFALPPRERLIISIYLEGEENAVIADIVGLSPNHVGVLVHRIRGQLIRSLGIQNGESDTVNQTDKEPEP